MKCPYCNNTWLRTDKEPATVCPFCIQTINYMEKIHCYCIHCNEIFEITKGNEYISLCPICHKELHGIYLAKKDIIQAYSELSEYLGKPVEPQSDLNHYNKQTLFFMFLRAYQEFEIKHSSFAHGSSGLYPTQNFVNYASWARAKLILPRVYSMPSPPDKHQRLLNSSLSAENPARFSNTAITEPLAFVIKYYLPPEFTRRTDLNVLVVGPGSNEFLESCVLVRMFPGCSYTSIDNKSDRIFNVHERTIHPFATHKFRQLEQLNDGLSTLLSENRNHFDLIIINHPRPGNEIVLSHSLELLQQDGYLIVKPFHREEIHTIRYINEQNKTGNHCSIQTVPIPLSRNFSNKPAKDLFAYIIQKKPGHEGTSQLLPPIPPQNDWTTEHPDHHRISHSHLPPQWKKNCTVM